MCTELMDEYIRIDKIASACWQVGRRAFQRRVRTQKARAMKRFVSLAETGGRDKPGV